MQLCEIEIDVLRLPVGKQDQFAATYGALNIISFKPNGNTSIEKIKNKKAVNFLKENLIIINTGIKNNNKIIFENNNKILKKKKNSLNI